MTDEGRRTAPKGARRLRRSPGEPHRTASGRLTGGTTPPCAALLAGTTVRAITAFQNGEDRPYGWAMKEAIPPTFPALFYGFVTTALYFVAASCIFPDEPDEWADLDAPYPEGSSAFHRASSFACAWPFFTRPTSDRPRSATSCPLTSLPETL